MFGVPCLFINLNAVLIHLKFATSLLCLDLFGDFGLVEVLKFVCKVV